MEIEISSVRGHSVTYVHYKRNIKLKGIYHFIYLGRVLIRNSYCRREITTRITMVKEPFSRKKSFLTNKPKRELRKIQTL
jgi:hypothetical protein